MLRFDIETNGLLEELTKVHCIVAKDSRTGEVRSWHGETLEDGVRFLQEAPELWAHNAIRFDVPALTKVYPWFKPVGVIRDSLLMSQLIYTDLKDRDFTYLKTHPEFPKQLLGRHSLEAWGWRLGMRKGDFGKTADWSTFTPEMLAYCIQDVEVLDELCKRLEAKAYSPVAVDLEHQFAEVIRLQEQHGVLFDTKAAVDFYGTLGQRRNAIEADLRARFEGWWSETKTPEYYDASWPGGSLRAPTKGEAERLAWETARAQGAKRKEITYTAGPMGKKLLQFNPGSRDHVSRWLIETFGWKPKEFGKDGKATLDETTLEGLVYPGVDLLREYYLIEKKIGQLAEGDQAWLKAVKKTGRIHGEVSTCGAVTRRCTHKRPNLAQVPRVGSPFGTECRSLFIAPPGYSMVGWDASGLEMRCLGHYLARWDNGAYAKAVVEGNSSEGTDPHSINSRALGLQPKELYTLGGKTGKGRDFAKTFYYAFMYGGGDQKIGSIVGKGKAGGAELRARFLKGLPAMGSLTAAVSAAVRTNKCLKAIDGGLLHVRSDHSALNTLLQSAGAILVKRATVILHHKLLAKGWTFGSEWAQVLHIHDEVQAYVRKGLEDEYGKAALESLQEAGRALGFRCPLDGEYKVGSNWASTH